MTGPQLAKYIGVTYRQVDWWTRQGYLHAELQVPPPGKYKRKGKGKNGSGFNRCYPPAEIAIADRMARWIHFGFTPQRAAELARFAPAGPYGRVPDEGCSG